MTGSWSEEQLTADGFERVYVESDWNGEPLAGLADIDGKPHHFEIQRYDPSEYQVWPASEAVAELEREQWAIYARWYGRSQAGEVGHESHPGHGGIDARYDELELLLAPHRLVPDGARRLVCELRFVAGVDVRYRVEGPDYWLRWRPSS
ncbi:hypothetical protein OG601_47865 [Streptomyces sp. NBC_01239]|uniref:hypothetical protein n=1 Tax=Streptomyces sp. NBC_01239 TaxID=2903792 RepID=UPI00225B77D8|nr:hypothetical protein [Streptomyces sp. NBC_01239]MCX4816712.1 hypothetical protein [Streptomyces sp. NBC_01239]MCX4818291.1 hypothetical protein [Streptomyces sp. NBC_01239]